jgi:hypothetical protein
MRARQSSGIFPGIVFALQVARLWYKGIRKAISSHVLIEDEEVKKQVDNKGRFLISCDALAAPIIDHRLVLICSFRSELSFYDASLLYIAMWLFKLLRGASFAEWIHCLHVRVMLVLLLL